MPHLYVLEENIGNSKLYKVGSTANIKARFNDLKRFSKGTLKIIYAKKFVFVEDAADHEMAIHRQLDDYRVPNRGREWYSMSRDDLLKTINESVNPDVQQLYVPAHYLPENARRDYKFFINMELMQKGIGLRDRNIFRGIDSSDLNRSMPGGQTS